MILVDPNEEVYFSTDEKSKGEKIVVTNRRIYHTVNNGRKALNTYKCLNIENVRMIEFTVKEKPTIKTLVFSFLYYMFLIYLVLSFLVAAYFSAYNPLHEEALPYLLLLPISISLTLAYMRYKYRIIATFLIEYSNGSKINIFLNIKNEETLYKIRNAILLVQDAYNPILQ